MKDLIISFFIFAIMLSAIIFFPFSYEPFFIKKLIISISSIFIFSLLAVSKWNNNKPNFAYLLLFIIFLISSIFPLNKHNLPLTLEEFYLLSLFAFLFISYRYIEVRKILDFGVVIGILVAIYSLIQYLDLDPILWQDTFAQSIRVFSTMGNPVFLGVILLFLMPPACIYFIRNDVKIGLSTLYLSAFIVMSISLYLTGARGCYVGFILQLFFILIYGIYLAKGRTNLQTISNIKLVILSIVMVGFLAIIALSGSGRTRLLSILSGEDAGLQGRLVIWDAGMRAFMQKPILGWGGGSFARIFPEFMPTNIYELAGYDYSQQVTHAHCFIIELLVESGLVGAGAIMALIAIIILKAVKYLIRQLPESDKSKHQSKRLALLGILCSVIGVLVSDLVGVSLMYPTPRAFLAIWLAMAISLQPGYQMIKQSKPQREASSLKSKTAAIIFAVLAALTLYCTFTYTLPRFVLGIQTNRLLSGSGSKHVSTKKLKEIYGSTPFAEYSMIGGELLLSGGYIEAALGCYRNAYMRNPGLKQSLFNIALCYYSLGRPDEAAEALQELLRYFPDFPDGNSLLGDCYLMAGRHASARKAYLGELEYNNLHQKALVGMARLEISKDNYRAAVDYTGKALLASRGRNRQAIEIAMGLQDVPAPKESKLLQSRCLVQSKAEAISKPLEPKIPRSQVFTSPSQVISSIMVRFATFEQRPRGRVILELRSANGDNRLLEQRVVDAVKIKDNIYYSFDLENLRVQRNANLRLDLYHLSAGIFSSPICVWVSIFDYLPGAQRFDGNEPAFGDICFKVCKGSDFKLKQ